MPGRVDKALFYEVQGHAGPGTHVLVIGIGDYPHLIDGSKENSAIAEGMGQLLSPPHSARALADWFLDEFRNAERPLASLALLLSEKKQLAYRGTKVPRGTIGDVSKAVSAWVTRASSDPDNLAIFYFAGHGVSAPSTQLLVRDYGSDAQNRFDGAINFDSFRAAMTTKPPGLQLFLIDACRSPDALVRAVQERGEKGRNVLTANQYREGGSALQSVHYAAAPFSEAYGMMASAGLYTQAIIQALNGGGAQADLGWWVGTTGLSMALSAYTPRLAAKLALKQVPETLVGMSFKIHQPPRPLRIPVYVSCAPKDVWGERIRFEAKLGGEIILTYEHDPQADPAAETWPFTVPLREHLVSARFGPDARYADVVDEILTVAPPETALPLEISEKQG